MVAIVRRCFIESGWSSRGIAKVELNPRATAGQESARLPRLKLSSLDW